MPFKNRAEAGRRLAAKLSGYKGSGTLVLALPRGGVPVAAAIANALEVPLDIIAVRKVGHPGDPEYAVCAVDERGTLLCSDEATRIDQAWLHKAIKKEQDEAARRLAAYRGARPYPSLAGKTLILVDDGAATGLTLRLAIKRALSEAPAKVLAAVPVIPAGLAATIEEGGVEVVALQTPEDFMGSVGAYYQDFGQVSDDEVIALLRQSATDTDD